MAAQGVDKTLRLVIHYGSLKRSAFVSALEERLAPALNKVRTRAPEDKRKAIAPVRQCD